jgi:hypothetical protein
MYQPYFAPFAGFFAKAMLSHVLVVLDTVQFPRGTTWLTRNRFKNDQGVFWMTVPVWKKGLGLQRIHEVRVCREGSWARKHLASLNTAYAKAPFFEDHQGFLTRIFTTGYDRLLDLNLEILRYLMGAMDIPTKVVRLSELGIDGKEPTLSVEVCRQVGADRFLAQRGAAKFLSEKAFEEEGIQLGFFSHRPPVYPQLWGPFISNLSVLDLLFNCGPKAGAIIRKASRMS